MEITVKKKCELGKVTWQYPTRELDKFGRLATGHTGGDDHEIYCDAEYPMTLKFGMYILAIEKGKATAGQFSGDFPQFIDADTAEERAHKIVTRITTVHTWVQLCLENDSLQTATGSASLPEDITRDYVMRATEKTMAEKKDTSDDVPF